jgi:hypothetical protein
MNCSNVVLIPTTAKESTKRQAIRSKLYGVCLFFFTGIHFDATPKYKLPCRPDYHRFTALTAYRHAEANETIVLPVVDSHHNMGRKIVHMLQWASYLNANYVLYLDMDVAGRTSHALVAHMFDEIAAKGDAVGDVLDCLTPANQVCCCGSVAQAHFASFYNLTLPYERAPPMLWGGGGIGLTNNALQRMVALKPSLHTTSDHTLSLWAHAAHVALHQASWSEKHAEWCSSGAMDVHVVDAQTWQCQKARHRNHTGFELKCSSFET